MHLFMYLGESLDYNSSQLVPGMSFKLSNGISEMSIFKNFLVVSTVTTTTDDDACLLDGFMMVDTNLDLKGVSLTSGCLAVKIGLIVLGRPFRHVLYFSGQEYATNAVNASFFIQSILEAPKVDIGHFVKVYAVEDGKTPNMELIYDLENMGVSGFIRNVNFSIFDSEIHLETTPIDIGYLSFDGTTVIFDLCDVHVIGHASTMNASYDSLLLELEAEITDGHKNFKNNLNSRLNSHIRSELDLVTRRRNTAQILYEYAIEMSTNISQWYDSVITEYNSLLIELESANDTVRHLTNVVQDAKQDLSDAVTMYSNESDGIDSCMDQVCSPICVDSHQLDVCHALFKFETFGICERIRFGDRVVTRYRQSERQAWRYDTVCYNCWNLAWYAIPYITAAECCSTVAVSYTERYTEPYHVTEQYQYTEYESCKGEEGENATVPVPCYREADYCSFEFHNLTCDQLITQCIGQEIDQYSDDATPTSMIQASYKNYAAVQGNLTQAEITLSIVEARVSIIEQELALLGNAKNNAMAVLKYRESVRNVLFDETKQYLNLINNESISTNFNILNITFSVTLASSTPVIIPVDFVVEHNNEVKTITIAIDFQASFEFIQQKVNVEILENFIGTGRKQKMGDDSLVSTRDNHLALACVEISNFDLFASQTLQELVNIALQINETLKRMENTRVCVPLNLTSNSSNKHGPYLPAQQETDVIIQRMQQFVSEYSMVYWLSGQAQLFENRTLSSEYNCIDEFDCLVVSLYDLIYILNDFQQLDEIKLVKDELIVQLGLYSTLELKLQSMYAGLRNLSQIISKIKANNHWCSKPPQLLNQLPLHLPVINGQPLTLSCTVHSLLPVQYYWLKNSKLLSHKTHELHIANIHLADSGEYQCMAINDAGRAISLKSQVSVYIPPVLTLIPEPVYETYLGNDNGFHLSCNASAYPTAGWKWLYKPSVDSNWVVLQQSNSNVLRFSRIAQNDEGYYACYAHNIIGNVTSDWTFLRVLPAEIIRVQYPVVLSFNVRQRNITKRSIVPENTLTNALVNEITNRLKLESTIANVRVTVAQSSSLHYQMMFDIAMPNNSNYSPSLTSYDLVSIMASGLSHLETDKNNIVDLFVANANAVIVQDWVIIPKSVSIESRHFACSEGYGISENQLLCGMYYRFIVLLFRMRVVYM